MNLKSLAIKNTSESNDPKIAYIEFEGEGVVRASDIQVDQDIEIMNPNQVIATLNGGPDSKLYMELTITKGRGYVSADKGKTDDMPIGVLAVDARFNPFRETLPMYIPGRLRTASLCDLITVIIHSLSLYLEWESSTHSS